MHKVLLLLLCLAGPLRLAGQSPLRFRTDAEKQQLRYEITSIRVFEMRFIQTGAAGCEAYYGTVNPWIRFWSVLPTEHPVRTWIVRAFKYRMASPCEIERRQEWNLAFAQ